ncbi:DeoR/GlpR transcriptional regulator [bacterium]|nr:DeoR/GlpR transcriptional regulator [bacterium]
MLSEERRQKIQEILVQNKRILVKDIAKRFNISEVTIRKDLEVLEKRGLLNRVHGGAILTSGSLVMDLAITEKENINPLEKERIAQKAKQFIEIGDVIILDSGSTTTRIARQIKSEKGITVITNAVNIASELASTEVNVLLTGGNLREKSFSLVGPIAEDSLTKITAKKLFLGVDGIDFDYGLTTPNMLEAKVNRMMMRAAVETILVADSSKFGRKSLGIIASIKDVNKVITDNNINESDYKKLNDLGIEVFIV